MRDKSDEYARFEEFCRRMARTTASAELRTTWKELADRWLSLMHRTETDPSSDHGEANPEGSEKLPKK